ncbi:unnamed protein product [Adineta steineri]|uniref:N-acetylgalactosaminide beta-1,3-galactosyltransferase n=1 Tax=Adineta steineri TaxID=433720 RepID=A0A815CX37_9BILA|nr:unnamed protein product [Adineta steineri]CAF3627269.1 unnamed protein product [Adineta steineri]
MLGIHRISFNHTTFFRFQNNPAQVRVLCLVLTAPKYFDTRTRAVLSTWGRRCNGLFFITESSNDTQGLPIAPIANITPGYEHLTQKTVLALQYAYEYHFNNFDWFVKADDDTYIFMENLKMFLSKQNTSKPVSFGWVSKIKGYLQGGASYVLSREALKRFNQGLQKPNTMCRKYDGDEDIEIRACLRSEGVYMGNSRDEKNRERFHPLNFYSHFVGPIPEWYKQRAARWPVTVSILFFRFLTIKLIDLFQRVTNAAVQM